MHDVYKKLAAPDFKFVETAALACEAFIAELEERVQPYLSKLHQSTGVKHLLERRPRHAQTLKLGASPSGDDIAPGRQN